ncbi:MAG TPA: cupin domain-containing protein [Thermoanaerobaculia bacterium]|nr:cupin domain-containing protein [Thermoanaerobaculia bacterium]
MKKYLITTIALAFLGTLAFGEEKAAAKKKAAAPAPHVIAQASDMKWGDAPPVFPAGAKMAVLKGDPSKSGMYIVRLKVPDGYKVAPHWHPMTENVTVISGTFNLGMGDEADPAKSTAMPAGAFASMPAKMHHYAWSKGETEVQVSGMGPFQLIYVNPADDPSKK